MKTSKAHTEANGATGEVSVALRELIDGKIEIGSVKHRRSSWRSVLT
jgi:hypothetical protein